MAAKSQYFKIGLFVIVGSFLTAGGIVALGLRTHGEEPFYVETYFEESVQGLSVGSPVKQRGVQIGTVSEISFVDFKYTLSKEIRIKLKGRPVYVLTAIDPQFAKTQPHEDASQLLAGLSERGLRVRLASQGITGLSYLDVDVVDPQTNPPMEIYWKPSRLYLPSAASTGQRVVSSIEDILASLGGVDFKGIGADLQKLLETVDKALNDAKVDKTAGEARELIQETTETVKRIRAILDKPEIDAAAADAQATMASAREAADALKPLMEDLAGTLKKTSTALEGVLGEAQRLMASESLRRAIDESPDAIAQLRRTLARTERLIAANQESVDALLRDLRRVTLSVDKISTNAEEYPSQVLFGEPPPVKKPEPRRP